MSLMLFQDPFAVPLNNEEQSELQITHTVPPKEVCKESRRRTAASDLAELTFECCSRTSANKENIEEPENEEESNDLFHKILQNIDKYDFFSTTDLELAGPITRKRLFEPYLRSQQRPPTKRRLLSGGKVLAIRGDGVTTSNRKPKAYLPNERKVLDQCD